VPHVEGVSVALSPLGARDAGIKGVARRVVSGWSDLTDAQMEVHEVEGGITNCMARCEVGKGVELKDPSIRRRVVVRVFGDDTEAFIDRTHEDAVLRAVTGAGFGAALLGTFENGRVDAWLEADTADTGDLRDPKNWPSLAALVARFHADAGCPGMPEQVHLWKVLDRWLEMARTVDLSDKPGAEAAREGLKLDQVEGELDEVRRACELARSPTVFCHNDLLAGNFMRDRSLKHEGQQSSSSSSSPPGNAQDGQVWRVIDFEYGCYNPRGFDLGNHFNEWAGFECEWELYPSKESQLQWLRHYRRASMGPGGGIDAEESAQIERMQVEAEAYTLASHVFWGLWAVLQARYSKISFDYLGYAGLRFLEFRKRKDERIKALRAAFA